MITYTKAKFWKCALQVNPSGYIAYRGNSHGLTEEEYNQKLVGIAKENDIKVIGLADHGNVDGVDAIRKLMIDNDIVVFPGFEISTTEKVHFVCLFPENTTKEQLHRFLGALGLTDPKDGIWPTNLGGNDLLSKVNELGGFSYAAHCTDENGILRQKLVHVWQNDLLKAAQIPGNLEDLKNDDGNKYRLILKNKDQHYLRNRPIGIINAKDVAVPEDLSNPKASCLIKMTTPCFESFKLAFHDSDSRVRLNSDISEKYYSQIIRITVIGGYLDGLDINFSEHLNSIIGGRGTGKSTLLEFIRYVFDKIPISKYAKKQHEEIIKENLGKSKARIEIIVRSSAMNGKQFTVSRRFGESSVVKDENGVVSSFTPSDLMPEIEIYGQNEIHESVQDAHGQRQILSRFLDKQDKTNETQIAAIKNKLAENRKKLIESHEAISTVEDEVARLPKLLEQVEQFKTLGLVEKLEIVPKLENEKQLIITTQEKIQTLESVLTDFEENISDVDYLDESVTASLPHAENLKQMRDNIELINKDAKSAIDNLKMTISLTKDKLQDIYSSLNNLIRGEEEALEKRFKELPSSEGRTGQQVGNQYKNLIAEIERTRPKQSLLNNNQNTLQELFKDRKMLLDELSSIRATRSSQYERMLKKLNKKLEGKLKLTISPEADRAPLVQKILNYNLDGVAEKRLDWINTAEDFSPFKLSELIVAGVEALKNAGWSITSSVADALVKIGLANRLEIEEIELPDLIKIEFNVAHDGAESYRDLNKLSPGQQCTAIMQLLLLASTDPLLMDQPEDNLDNSFIADRIVNELRTAKIERQFIFATHNANIPVFGDAEWIGVFDSDENHADLPATCQGAIDVPEIRDKAASILEGGKVAFNQRKAKYGF